MNSLFKFKTFFLLLLTSLSKISANQVPCGEFTQEILPCSFSQSLFEFKTGYFFFSNSKMRKIYNKGGLDVQLCASYPLWNFANRWTLNVYGALEYFYRSGKSINRHQKTSLWSIPLNIGFKPVYKIDANAQCYFAIGPRYFYARQHNCSSYVYHNKSGSNLGFFINTGYKYAFCNQFIIDVFGEYSYAKMNFRGGKPRVYTRSVEVGGFTFGGGLGYEF